MYYKIDHFKMSYSVAVCNLKIRLFREKKTVVLLQKEKSHIFIVYFIMLCPKSSGLTSMILYL